MFLEVLKTFDTFSTAFELLFREAGVSAPQYNVLRILRGAGGPLPGSGTFEGTATAQAAVTLADRLGVDCPIVKTVAALVAGRLTVREAVGQLYNRPLRREHG